MSKMSNFVVSVNELWCAGYSVQEIANQLNTTEFFVKNAVDFDADIIYNFPYNEGDELTLINQLRQN